MWAQIIYHKACFRIPLQTKLCNDSPVVHQGRTVQYGIHDVDEP